MKKNLVKLFILSILVLSSAFLSSYSNIAPADAAFNGQINYQGKLTNASYVAVADGTYNMEFKLYTVSSGGSAIWTETRTGADKVQVTNGVFSIMLGSVTAITGVDFNQTLYLGVNIGGTGSPSWDGEMTPRKTMGAVPAAFVANGLQGTGVIDITNTGTQASLNYDGSNKLTVAVGSNGFTTFTSTGSSAGFNLNGGNIGIGTATTSAKLHVTATTEQFRISYDPSNYTSFTTSSGGDLTIAPSGSDLAITGNVDVSGTLTSGTANAFNVNSSGAVTAGTWNGTAIGSTYGGTGLNTAASSGVPSINSGTWQTNAITPNGVLYGGASNALSFTAQGGANTVLVANGGAPSFSAAITVGTSISSPSITGSTSVTTPTLTSAGALSITTASNGDISLTPNGTGSVLIPASTKFGSNTTNAFIQFQTSGNNLLAVLDGNQAFNISNSSPNGMSALWTGRNNTRTTGTTNTFEINPTFAPTSGTGVQNTLVIDPTVNQTGGSNGISRGLYINPTLTSAQDFRGSDNVFTIAGALSGSTVYGSKIAITNNQATNVNTVYGEHISFVDAGSLANTVTGLAVDATTANASDTTYAATFKGGNVGIGTTTPTSLLHVSGPSDMGINIQSTTDGSAGITFTNDNYRNWTIGLSSTLDDHNFVIRDNTAGAFRFHIGSTGNVGISTTAADRRLEINDASGNNLRLTYNDADGSAVNYTDLLTTSGGALTIQPSGFIANIGGGTTRTALRFLEPSATGTDYVGIQASANVTTSYTWTLPAADASGCIQSNGSGTLSIAACGGGSLTPWTSDIVAAGFDLTDLSNLLFRETTGAPTSTDVGFYRDNSGDLTGNTLTGKTFNLAVNGTDEYNFSSTGLAFNSNNITGLGTNVTATAGLTITSTSANLAFTTSTSGNITFAPASTGSVQITSGVTTGATTSSGLSIAANSLTQGTGLYIASSTLTTGSLVDLQVSGTAGASSQKIINALTTGAITGTQTTYGAYFANTHSGGTSTNIALYATATSGTNNYAAIFEAGSVGIGTTGPDRTLDVLNASAAQLRLTTTDGSVYSDMQNTANANLIVSGSSLGSSSASQYGLQITPTIAQSSTANYRALDVNVTETSISSITDLNRLADFRVGGSSKVAISNNGSITLQNASNLVTPYGGIGDFQNHLVRSEEFDNASWVKTNVTAPTANTQTAPDGSTSAESLATTSSGGDVCQWSGTSAGSNTFTFSVWARSTSGTQNFDMRVDAGSTSCATANNVTGTAYTHTATTSWQRFTVTQTFSSATGNVKVRIFPGTTGSTGTIYAWAAQLDQATKPSNYVLTTSAALTNTNRGDVVESNFATAAGFTYGGRRVTTLTGAIAASSTTVGQLIRVIDNATGTDDTETVRGLEVQSYSGTNLNGVNTAIAGFGYTFGVHAVTTAQANESAQPAAVFADLDNGSATTQGNAIRAYTNDATSADLVSFYQETSAFTGNGLVMNFGNNSGSFSGNFLNLKAAGTTKAHIDSNGYVFASLTSSGTAALCWDGTGGTDERIQDCSGSPVADYAEMYPVTPNAEVGDIMTIGQHLVNTYDIDSHGSIDWNKVKGTVNQLVKSTGGYQKTIVGVVSDNHGDFSSTGYNIKDQDNPQPIALKGRIPVKVTNENGAIKAGDYITTSGTLPGYGMKATRSGQVVGQALADINFEDSSTGQVMIFVQVGYQNIGNTIVLDAPATNGIDLQNGSNSSLSNTASTFVIQQQTSEGSNSESNILQLQTGDANRFMVSSSGATSILSNLNCEADADSCPSVLKVTQSGTELVNIDARGNLALTGTIFIKDDTFAGSVATDENGLAEITFSYNLGTGKPVVQLTAEAKLPVFPQILEFKKDEKGNYTGFVIKTFDLMSGPVRAIVHYTVVGKEDGYITLGEIAVPVDNLEVTSSSNSYASDGGEGVGMVIDNSQVAGAQGSTDNPASIQNQDFTVGGVNDNITSSSDGNITNLESGIN